MIFEDECYKCDKRPSEKECSELRAKYREKGYNYHCKCGGIIQCVNSNLEREFRKGINCQKNYEARKAYFKKMMMQNEK